MSTKLIRFEINWTQIYSQHCGDGDCWPFNSINQNLLQIGSLFENRMKLFARLSATNGLTHTWSFIKNNFTIWYRIWPVWEWNPSDRPMLVISQNMNMILGRVQFVQLTIYARVESDGPKFFVFNIRNTGMGWNVNRCQKSLWEFIEPPSIRSAAKTMSVKRLGQCRSTAETRIKIML